MRKNTKRLQVPREIVRHLTAAQLLTAQGRGIDTGTSVHCTGDLDSGCAFGCTPSPV